MFSAIVLVRPTPPILNVPSSTSTLLADIVVNSPRPIEAVADTFKEPVICVLPETFILPSAPSSSLNFS